MGAGQGEAHARPAAHRRAPSGCSTSSTRSGPLLVQPSKLVLGRTQADELNRGFAKLNVAFTLPPGSYATLVVKRLFHKTAREDTARRDPRHAGRRSARGRRRGDRARRRPEPHPARRARPPGPRARPRTPGRDRASSRSSRPGRARRGRSAPGSASGGAPPPRPGFGPAQRLEKRPRRRPGTSEAALECPPPGRAPPDPEDAANCEGRGQSPSEYGRMG